jgi:hypothetical protein
MVIAREGVVYAAASYDITPAILAALQARGAASSSATPAPAKPAAPTGKPQTH